MDEIIKWVTTYSPPIVLLLLLCGGLLYLLKVWTEKFIATEFDKHKKAVELALENRSSFEQKILLDRYMMIRKIQTKIGKNMTNINRVRHGATIEGFIVQTGMSNDIPSLTEVFETLAVNRYLITEKFHDIFWRQSQLAMRFLNEKDKIRSKELEDEYLELLASFYREVNAMFDLEKIRWTV